MTALLAPIPMSKEQLKAFLEKVKGDTSLQKKLKVAANAEDVAAIAKEAGFMISADEAFRENPIRELSDDELEAAAGGAPLTAYVDVARLTTKLNPAGRLC
jgi:predicted ribosomally synthesized peptide with nif11-like leader